MAKPLIVDVTGHHLNEIYVTEDLSLEENSRDHLDLWCKNHCRDAWSSHIYSGFARWFFMDTQDAVLFKLTWG